MSDKEKVFPEIFAYEELYSVEDYSTYHLANTFLTQNTVKQNINSSEYIRVMFDFGNNEKEILLKKENAKKIYSFIKIIYNNANMNILILNQSKYAPEIVLEKINSRKFIRGFIKINLKIQEFPLYNFHLEDTNMDLPDFEKVFLLKNGNQNPNPLYQNPENIHINNNDNSFNNPIITKVFFDKNNIKLNTNNNFNNLNPNNIGFNNFNNNNNNVNQIDSMQNFNNNNNNFNNNNFNNFNLNSTPNFPINQQQNIFNQSSNYNQNHFMNNNNMNLMNSNSIQSNNGNYTNLNNMNQNFNNNMNMNSMSMNKNSMSMNMNMNSLNMNSMNTPYPMNNQQFQSLSNFNNRTFNSMSNNNMNSNTNFNNSSSSNSFQNNNYENSQKQNNSNVSNFALLFTNIQNSPQLFPKVGLRNVGLTCYMNSTLQCLLHIPELIVSLLIFIQIKKII